MTAGSSEKVENFHIANAWLAEHDGVVQGTKLPTRGRAQPISVGCATNVSG